LARVGAGVRRVADEGEEFFEGTLRDNAAVATFLASDDSTYMSGIVIPSCDGGSFARSSIPFPDEWSLEDQVSQ
jgi:hypothetical protein